MSILSSPFYTLSVVDTALKSAMDPHERLRLLSARVHLLQPKNPPSSPSPPPTPLLAARLDLADAYLLLPVPDLHAAAGEAMAVENECKRLGKASKRWDTPPEWLPSTVDLRKRALRLLATVEDGLGRPARAERNRSLAEEL